MSDLLYDNDPTLFERFRQGDTGAAGILFDRYAKPLLFYVERLTGDRVMAEDVVSESFIKVLQEPGRFQNLENVRAFLYRIARNAAINVLRADSRHRRAHEQLGWLARAEEGREAWLDNEEIRAEMLGVIYLEMEQLPGKCRDIFKAIFLQGLSNEQIASQMGISVQTVRTQKSRAIGLLRVRLLKKGQLLAALYFLDLLAVHA